MSKEHGITSIRLRHNMEVAHRLFRTPGKCEAIHGHSMWVELEMWGWLDLKGIMCGMEFGEVKREFRGYLDAQFDHHLLLNKDDPFAGPLLVPDGTEESGSRMVDGLPGIELCNGDPTTENLAKWIGHWSANRFAEQDIRRVRVVVHETSVNMASWDATL